MKLIILMCLLLPGCALRATPQAVATTQAVHPLTLLWTDNPEWPVNAQFIVQVWDPTAWYVDEIPAAYYDRSICGESICSVYISIPNDKQHTIMVRVFTADSGSIGSKIGYPNPLPPDSVAPTAPRNLRITKIG